MGLLKFAKYAQIATLISRYVLFLVAGKITVIHAVVSRRPEMPRKGDKWCLVAESQQADRRSCQRMPYLHQDEN